MTPEEYVKNPVKSVVIYPNEVLTTPTTDVTDLGPWEKIGEIMSEVMIESAGIGLAAPQVNLPYRAFVIRFFDKNLVYINPEIVSTGERFTEEVEGCLSLPGVAKKVSRPRKIKVKWTDTKGKEHRAAYEGTAARVFQHEYDHLSGVLIINK